MLRTGDCCGQLGLRLPGNPVRNKVEHPQSYPTHHGTGKLGPLLSDAWLVKLASSPLHFKVAPAGGP